MKPYNHKLSLEKVRYHDLAALEKLFAAEFTEELHISRIKQRIRRMRQFYYFLLPLSNVSMWAKNLFSIYILKIDGLTAGFVQLSYINRNQLHVDFIAIAKKYRGKGLGTWLLKEIFKTIADKKNLDVILEVNTNNPAYNLYRRLGFKIQAKVLHYHRRLEQNLNFYTKDSVAGLRKLKASDRRKLLALYKNSIPNKIHNIVKSEYRQFNPDMFTRQLNWIKDKLMNNVKREYVVERNCQIIAYISIYSYPNISNHVFNIILDPNFEYLRHPLIEKILNLLRCKYGSFGDVTTTIYNDNRDKQRTLESMGFKLQNAYYLMKRASNTIYMNQSRCAVGRNFPMQAGSNRCRQTIPIELHAKFARNQAQR